MIKFSSWCLVRDDLQIYDIPIYSLKEKGLIKILNRPANKYGIRHSYYGKFNKVNNEWEDSKSDPSKEEGKIFLKHNDVKHMDRSILSLSERRELAKHVKIYRNSCKLRKLWTEKFKIDDCYCK